MPRILAIDYGNKRCGIAATDPLQLIASGLDTVSREELLKFLEDYFQKEEVECLVIGLPLRLNNELSEVEVEIQKLIEQLNKKHPQLRIEREDERFTSKLAFDSMLKGGVKKQKRRDKALIDKVSATIILQSYMERRSL